MQAHKMSIFVAILLSMVTIMFWFVAGQGLDHIGVRVTIPVGKLPFMVGVDIGTRLTFGWAMASLLLSPDGKTLMLASTEVELAGAESAGLTLIRGTIGLSYFDLSAILPCLIFGGGLSYRFSFDDQFSIAASGEFIYPLALGPPMFTFSAGWLP
jgi:hypothetical protein